jgi:HD-GYP domain-containing protein (c-di-GMP phosphodiesterase class II)
MTDTKDLLNKITALRLRLHQAQASTAAPPVPAGATQEQDGERATLALATQVQVGAWHNAFLDEALRQLSGDEETPVPTKLTARAARALGRGRELLHQLRDMLEDPLLRGDVQGPLGALHQEIASMLDVLLRIVQAFPPSTSAQLRLCAGVEATLRAIEERLTVLCAALTHRRREMGRVESLAGVLGQLAAGEAVNPRPILGLAEELAREAKAKEPLRFLSAPADEPARFVAAHSITVAQVMARLLGDDPDWKERVDEALFAALVHDVGMVRVPVEVLAKPGPLTDEERRVMERHTTVGAQLIGSMMPGGGIFVEGAADHHERLDGTGYPAGKRDLALGAFVRILAICDVYAAMAAKRPHRPAHQTRTALADTLLLAEQGALDRVYAEKLLALSFYPAGSVVELNDGTVGYVVAAQPGRQGIDNPSKPVLMLLTGPGGQALALPGTLNLVEDRRTIVRSLAPSERRQLLLAKYPELV